MEKPNQLVSLDEALNVLEQRILDLEVEYEPTETECLKVRLQEIRKAIGYLESEIQRFVDDT